MRKLSVLCLVATALLLVAPMNVLAMGPSKFPGRGSKDVWSKACVHYNYALDEMDVMHLDLAVGRLQQAIFEYPHSDCFYRQLGRVYEARSRSGDMMKAEGAYRKAADLDSSDWRNWNGLANVYVAQDRLKDAQRAFKKALRNHPPEEVAENMHKSIVAMGKKLRSKDD